MRVDVNAAVRAVMSSSEPVMPEISPRMARITSSIRLTAVLYAARNAEGTPPDQRRRRNSVAAGEVRDRGNVGSDGESVSIRILNTGAALARVSIEIILGRRRPCAAGSSSV